MTLLRLLNRSAFICNICFLLAIGILIVKSPHDANPGLGAVIIVMGFFMSVILNIIVNIWLGILKLRKKPVSEIPAWLRYTNGGFMIIQLIYLFR